MALAVAKQDGLPADGGPLGRQYEQLSLFEAAAIASVSDVLESAIFMVGASTRKGLFLRQLRAGNIMAASQALSWSEFDDVMALLERLFAQQMMVGAFASLPPTAIGLTGAFAPGYPLAEQSARLRAARLIREVTVEQQSLVRDTIVRSMAEGLSVDDIARVIRQSIGLHSRWANAVTNRYDRTLSSLLESGIGQRSAMEQANALAEKYHARLLRARARMIARTEVLSAHNEGRWFGWNSAMMEGLVPVGARKQWLVRIPAELDSPCDDCIPLSESGPIPWNQPFDGGVMMPPLHPNCVCTAILILDGSEDYRDYVATILEEDGWTEDVAVEEE